MLRPVVAGLDGSRESLAAADWAAREALLRGLPLRLVHAWEGLSSYASELPELEAPRSRARRILRGAVDELDERYPRLRPSADPVARPACEALVAAGADAELLVLGSRALSGVGGYLAGSVALATVAHATCPVVLVRADETAADEHEPGSEDRPTAHGPYRDVVVGLDPAHPCEEVLAFAFGSAVLRGARLRVVHAWRLAYGHVPGTVDSLSGLTTQMTREQALTSVVRPWREKNPTVVVRELVEYGRAAEDLLHASADAGLLVVGRRTRTARLGTHTGPVAHAMMHHAPCPVAVVPHA